MISVSSMNAGKRPEFLTDSQEAMKSGRAGLGRR